MTVLIGSIVAFSAFLGRYHDIREALAALGAVIVGAGTTISFFPDALAVADDERLISVALFLLALAVALVLWRLPRWVFWLVGKLSKPIDEDLGANQEDEDKPKPASDT